MFSVVFCDLGFDFVAYRSALCSREAEEKQVEKMRVKGTGKGERATMRIRNQHDEVVKQY